MILLTDEEIHEATGIEWNSSHLRVRDAQLKKIYDWGNEPCPHWVGDLKRECPDCWQTLLEEINETNTKTRK